MAATARAASADRRRPSARPRPSAHRPAIPGRAARAVGTSVFAVAATAVVTAVAAAPAAGQTVTTTTTTVGTGAYYTVDTNSCAIALNNLTTATVSVGGTPTTYQFATYYSTGGNVMIGRRAPGAAAWTTVNSGLTATTTEMADDHNVIALGVDGTGVMHVSWNMHNQALNYAVSGGSVMGASFAPTFAQQTAATAPGLFPSAGATTDQVTYPIFLNVPNSRDLLFTYRDTDGTSGGSGNGNQYVDRYDATAKTWTNALVIDGQHTSVNAYLNRPAYTPSGKLVTTWTWRATSNWQTNSNIMFGQSPDNGLTWFKMDGSTQYALPIVQALVAGDARPASAVAEVVKAIPQNSSFINQTSMALDANDNPYVATYWAPGTTGSTDATKAANGTTNNPNRQYMLVYYAAGLWRTSQVSNRTTDAAFDTSGGSVRDLGRPLVLIDRQGRVLVIGRSEDTAGAGPTTPSTPNGITAYWNTAASLASATPAAWQTIALDATNMGTWEPTYDANLWAAENRLELLYEPTGLTGQSSGTVRAFSWDEQAYFAGVPEPTAAATLATATVGLLAVRRRRDRRLSQPPSPAC